MAENIYKSFGLAEFTEAFQEGEKMYAEMKLHSGSFAGIDIFLYLDII